MKKPTDDSARELLAGLPDARVDDVALRRLRQRIIDSVTDDSPKVTSRHRWRAVTAGVVAASALVGGALMILRHHQGVESPALARVSSANGSPIAWTRGIDGKTEWVDLRDGWFRLEIAPHAADRRVILRTPDGRIDDLGTVLDVQIAHGRTTQVHVQQGHVQLWLNVAPGLVLGDGETWASPAPVPPPSLPEASPPGIPAPASPAGLTAPSRHKVVRRAALPQPDASEQEDAAYLAVIRLLRSSHQPEARAAAEDYLRRFPHGFRHDEMHRLVDSPRPSAVKETRDSGQNSP